MNHFIWLSDANGNTFLQLASMITSIYRHPTGSILTLNTGSQVISQTKPEVVEERLNDYLNNLLILLSKGGRP